MKLGWIGTGLMGAAMVRRVRAAGHEVTAWNRTITKAEPLRADGIRVAAGPREALLAGETTVLMVSDITAIRDALLPKLVSGAIRVPDSYDPDDALGTVAEAAGVAAP